MYILWWAKRRVHWGRTWCALLEDLPSTQALSVLPPGQHAFLTSARRLQFACMCFVYCSIIIVRPHWMCEMLMNVTDDPRVCCILYQSLSISLSVTCLHPANTAGWIEVLYVMEALRSPRHMVLDGCPDPLFGGEGNGGKFYPLYSIWSNMTFTVHSPDNTKYILYDLH